MLNGIKTRLDKIAELGCGTALRVIAALPDGSHEEMSVEELIQRNLVIVRVASGNSLKDLDKLLEYERAEAYKEIPPCDIQTQ